MDDRTALLTAIRSRPDDDTARLVYADYLDGLDAPTDRDRATAEFIRMSCDLRGSMFMPRKVYPWLLSKGEDGRVVENWKRLLPSVMAIDAAHSRPGDECIGERRGRSVSTSVALPRAPGDPEPTPRVRHYVAHFEFHRGFVKTVVTYSVYAASMLLEAMHRDQPLLELHVAGLSLSRARGLVEMLERLAGPDAAKRFTARLM